MLPDLMGIEFINYFSVVAANQEGINYLTQCVKFSINTFSLKALCYVVLFSKENYRVELLQKNSLAPNYHCDSSRLFDD